MKNEEHQHFMSFVQLVSGDRNPAQIGKRKMQKYKRLYKGLTSPSYKIEE